MAGGSRGEQAGLTAGHLPLIELTQIGRLDLLRQLHNCISIPTAVAREVEPTLPILPDWVLVAKLAHPLQPGTVNLAGARGLEHCEHLGPSVVDHQTLVKSWHGMAQSHQKTAQVFAPGAYPAL